jgi:cytochrome oxidase Cu insertion factor (SCO1/SenC/PrrC family)
MKRRAVLFAGAYAVTAAAVTHGADPADSRFASNFDGMRLRDQDDRPFELASLSGKVTLFNFVFTGCSTVCPIQTRVLADVLDGLDAAVQRKVRFVSVSLDPLADSPSVLKAFARRVDADRRAWRFITGQPRDVERLAEKLRLFPASAGTRRPVDHATALWLVDSEGRLAQRYNGNPPDPVRLRDELTVFSRQG